MTQHDVRSWRKIQFSLTKKKIGRPEHWLTPHLVTSDNISFLPYPPSPHTTPRQSGRHMCITLYVVLNALFQKFHLIFLKICLIQVYYTIFFGWFKYIIQCFFLCNVLFFLFSRLTYRDRAQRLLYAKTLSAGSC